MTSVAFAQNRPIESGFLFVESRYIAPPYVFRTQNGQAFVNDLALDATHLDIRQDHDRRRGRGEDRREREPWRKLRRELENGSTVILLDSHRPVLLQSGPGRDFLEILSKNDARRKAATEGLDWLPTEIEDATWRRWFAEFEPTAGFLERAVAEIDRIDAIESVNLASNSAVRWIDASAYPLTVLGMVVVVLSLGHLLSHRPALHAASEETQLSPETSRIVFRSLILVCLLSGLDLIWTLLVSRTGSMRELNPLGSRLIEDPAKLILFKSVATFISVGLLFFLRRFSFARLASWWACLVCTLLAVRWLTFNSMFVS
jgi:hypothetical protein